MVSRALRRLFMAAVLGVAAFSLSAQTSERFYDALLARGELEYQSGRFSEAVRSLTIASFGLMERLSQYEKAQILLTLSEEARGNSIEARAAVRRVLQAESIDPTYPPAGLDVTARASFEAAVERLLPDLVFPPPTRQTRSDTTFIRGTSEDPPPSAREPEESTGSTRHTEERIAELREKLRQIPDDVAVRLELADAHVGVGQLDEAHQLVDSVLAVEAGNRDARIIGAKIALRQRRWDRAIGHLTVADAAAPLDDEAVGALLIAQVNAGHFEDAKRTAVRLTPEIRAREEVRQALDRIPNHPESRSD